MIREDRELLAELYRLNAALASLALRIMDAQGHRCRTTGLCTAVNPCRGTVATTSRWDECDHRRWHRDHPYSHAYHGIRREM